MFASLVAAICCILVVLPIAKSYGISYPYTLHLVVHSILRRPVGSIMYLTVLWSMYYGCLTQPTITAICLGMVIFAVNMLIVNRVVFNYCRKDSTRQCSFFD